MAADAHCVPQQGTLFAGRYRLEEPRPSAATVDGQPMHWRGFDEVLNRPVLVTVLLADTPAGAQLLASAVANGRVSHPGIASVFDAANVDGCTYVVSEWVEGTSLTDLLRANGPLPTARAAALVQEAAGTIAVLHQHGLVHGNLVPGNVVLTAEGVKLTSLRSNTEADAADDVRRLGGLLYAALTERWPGSTTQIEIPELPEAPSEGDRLCEPRQVRAGVSRTLSSLAMAALDPVESGIDAEHLANGLIDHTDEADVPSLDDLEVTRRRSWRRGAVLVGVLLVISVAGLVVGFLLGAIKPTAQYPLGIGGRAAPSPSPVAPATIRPVDARILDPQGDGTETHDARLTWDGKLSTAWRTDDYNRPKFGNLKRGMGVILDLGSSRQVRTVTVDLTNAGGTTELRASDDASALLETRSLIPAAVTASGTKLIFALSQPTRQRYWLVWFTELPPRGEKYGIGVAEVHFG
ncbi:MAG: protein kinase family protein [Pseudonocardiales bacterium]